MSEDVGYGDCRDTCVEYAINSNACIDCLSEQEKDLH